VRAERNVVYRHACFPKQVRFIIKKWEWVLQLPFLKGLEKVVQLRRCVASCGVCLYPSAFAGIKTLNATVKKFSHVPLAALPSSNPQYCTDR